MGSNHHADSVFKEKRIPKGPIKFNIQLEENQKEVASQIDSSKISIVVADPGCGKTTISLFYALGQLRKRNYENLIITKPIVEVGTSIGFLPGTIQEKIDIYMESYYSTIDKIAGVKEREKLFSNENIIFKPIQYIRGNNFDNSIIIFDEAQGCTLHEIVSFVTRMSSTSKMIILTDPFQTDIKNSGIKSFIQIVEGIEDVKIINLNESFQKRSPLIQSIYKKYKDFILK